MNVIFGGLTVICFLIPNIIVGSIASGFNTILNGSPLQKICRVCKTYEYMLLALEISLSILLLNVFWFAYGILIENIFIIIPNAFGIIVQLICIICNRIFKCVSNRKGFRGIGENPQSNMEGSPESSKEVMKESDIHLHVNGENGN